MSRADRKAAEEAKTKDKDKDKDDSRLSRELESTFPASDPPASTQPGGGVTGPEVAKPR